jgi:MarR family transcriptional regulator, organic hydroperoxide resistance regulator
MKPLDDYLPYLLNRAGARIAAAFTEVVRGYGITLPMWRVLAALNEADGQRMGDLAGRTSIDGSTLSRVIDAMQRQDLVARQRQGSDARSVTVHRTPAGAALTQKIVPVALHYETAALTGFSGPQAKLLKRMLTQVFRNIDALEEEQRQAERQEGEREAG